MEGGEWKVSKRKKWGLAGGLLGFALLIGGCTSEKGNEATPAPTSSGETTSSVIMITGDTVTGTGGCVLQSRFVAGDRIVFRANAVDPSTNEQLKDAVMKVHLSNGDVLDMKYGAHPAGSDVYFWTAAYSITDQTPTGTLNYYVTAEHGSMKGEFHPFNVAPSLLTIVDPQAVNGEAPQEEEQEKAEAAAGDVETNQVVDIIATNFAFNQDKWYVKAGEEVTVNLKSEEGIHGIAIEGLNVEIKESEGTIKFTPEKPGEYKIYCNIFCGAGHEDMVSTLVVV